MVETRHLPSSAFARNPEPVQIHPAEECCLSVGRTAVLPINSDGAAPYSFQIVDARR
jgi:hypothetical protein